MTVYNDLYNRGFRKKLLMLCLDNMWMNKFGEYIIRPEYFDSTDEQEVVTAVLEYRRKYNTSPRDPDDLIAMLGDDYSSFIYDIYDNEDVDLSLAADMAIMFAKEQAARLAILESLDDVMSGNLQPVIERIQAAVTVGEEIYVKSLDPVRDVDEWLYTYWEDKVRTGFPHVDVTLEGGVSAGELGVVLAPPNRGKSMALVNIGMGAATIGSAANVVHLTHEMSEAQVAKRYASRLMFAFPSPTDDLKEYAEEYVLAARKLLTGNIRIYRKCNDTADIERYIRRLESTGFHTDLIIDDYLDLVIPPRHYKEKRFELASLYEWFRSFCTELGIPGWTASQASRGALSKEIVTMADIAEDIQKAAIADIVMSICQTDEELRQERCRLYMAKVRDSKKGAIIRAKYYSDAQAIISTGFVKYDDSEDGQSV